MGHAGDAANNLEFAGQFWLGVAQDWIGFDHRTSLDFPVAHQDDKDLSLLKP